MAAPVAAPVARLQVSVIEARNVEADASTPPDFYVKLKMAGNEFQTDIVRGSVTPKFLKDIRLNVMDPDKDFLKMEMMQVGPKGDLVLGSEKLALKPLAETGTLVQWFNLKDPAGTPGAELCLVLRYSAGGDKTPRRSRSKSPAARSISPSPGPRVAAAPKKPKKKSKKGGKGMILPLPLAIAGGVLAGVFAFVWSRRPMYYEVQEGDTLCRIGICFNKPHQTLYNVNSKVISDPNVIYPGDRIRVA